jgi:hypothetical protein
LFEREKKKPHIIADKTVPSPLREKADGEYDTHTPAVTRSLEESEVRGRVGNLVLDRERLANLAVGKVDEWVALAAIRMVLDENRNGLRVATLCDEPAGALGDEPDKDSLKERGDGLQDGGDAPGPDRAFERLEGRVRNPGRENTSNVPAAIVHGSDRGSLRGICQFGDEEWRGVGRETQANSDYLEITIKRNKR